MTKMKKKKTTNNDPYLLKGEEALLLAEACKLDKQRKDAEKRLKEIKKAFTDLKEKGEYSNSAGDRVIVSFRDKYTEMEPKEVQKLLKSKKLGKYFWKCVKIALTETKKYLTEKEIDDLRTKLDPPIKAFSFK